MYKTITAQPKNGYTVVVYQTLGLNIVARDDVNEANALKAIHSHKSRIRWDSIEREGFCVYVRSQCS